MTAGAAVVAELNHQLVILAEQLAKAFATHPDARIIRSQPGLGAVLGARLLGEFGDDPDRYRDARLPPPLRRDRADHQGVGNQEGGAGPLRAQPPPCRRLLPVGLLRPHALTRGQSLLRCPPGARQHPRPDQALRVLANKLVGILDGCLRSRSLYNEATAWKHQATKQAA